MKYHILGIERSGTTSLEAKLNAQGHEVVRHEWAYCCKGVKAWHDKYFADYIPTFIVRDPVERCYSDYQYAISQRQIENISYIHALLKYPRFGQGSCYTKWLDQFPARAIFHLEILNMEHLNKLDYLEITPDERILTLSAIETAMDTDYHREDIPLENYRG